LEGEAPTEPSRAQNPGSARASPSSVGEDQTILVRSGDESVRVLKRCAMEEPNLPEVLPQHWAACHQIPQYDGAPLTTPLLPHKREVTPMAVVDGDPEKIVKQEAAT
jgi:hypothetical protein